MQVATGWNERHVVRSFKMFEQCVNMDYFNVPKFWEVAGFMNEPRCLPYHIVAGSSGG